MGSTINSSALRISGLQSGLDTETLVKQLTKANQLRIQTATQQKITLEWKQDFYKEIIGKLSTLQSKYFGTSSFSLTAESSLGQISANGFSSPYLTVAPGSMSAASNVYIDDIISVASAATLQGGSVSAPARLAVTTDSENPVELSGKQITLSLDGKEKTLTFTAGTNASVEEVRTQLQSLVDNAFGTGKITVSENGGALDITAAGTSVVALTNLKDSGDIFAFTSGTANRVDINLPLSLASLAISPLDDGSGTPLETIEFEINGKSFTFSSATTLKNIMASVNSSDAGVTISYSQLTDSFTLTSKDTGVASQVTASDVSGSLIQSLFGDAVVKNGTDAQIRLSLNGSTDEADLITITRSDNSFDLDGTTYTILGKAADNAKEALSVHLTHNVDKMVETIKSFVTDYNDLLNYMTTKVSEKRYRDYSPLTDEQKEEMSDSEISLWTDKAKSGLLQNDTYLKSIVNDLRSSLYTGIQKLGGDEALGITLADVGITTGNYYERGQLHLDENKLRQAISERGDEVMNLFTQKSNTLYSAYATPESQQNRYNESGIFWRLSDIMQKNLSTIGKKGALIELVGGVNDTYSTETIYGKRIKDMEDTIEKLNEKLADDEDRYWAQFTAMETALSKLQSQSSWIASMMSSN